MILRSFLTTILAIIFLRLTSATRHSSWDPASTSFDSKTNDQTKNRLKSGISERISQLGGDSMPNSMRHSDEDDGNIHSVRSGYENKHIDPDFRSRDYEYQYRDEPRTHVTGGHHNNKNNFYKKNTHENFVHEVQMPFKTHRGRLRRKLEEDKINTTQHSNATLHDETAVEMHQIGSEEHKNGTKKPCIRTHPYTIISSPTSNVTHNNSDSSNLKTTDSKNKTTNHTIAVVPNSNGTRVFKNETKENSTTSLTGKDKLPKDVNIPDMDATLKGNDSGKSQKQKGQGFGLSCNVVGQWVSETGGVTLRIKESQIKSHLDVEVVEQSLAKKGFLSPSWKIYGNLPFADSGNNKANGTGLGGPIVLTATILKDPSENSEQKVAVFLGECRACYEGMESVVGMWSLKRLSKDCLDASLSQREIRDVFHREIISTAKEQSKSGDSDTTKPKDSVDQNRKSHSYWRRSYNKDGKHRRYSRNNPRYVKRDLGYRQE